MQSELATVAGTCHSVLKSLIPALKYRSFNNIGNSRKHFTNPPLSSTFFVTPDFPRHPASARISKLLFRKLRPFGQPLSPADKLIRSLLGAGFAPPDHRVLSQNDHPSRNQLLRLDLNLHRRSCTSAAPLRPMSARSPRLEPVGPAPAEVRRRPCPRSSVAHSLRMNTFDNRY